jgi:hypothetical protein
MFIISTQAIPRASMISIIGLIPFAPFVFNPTLPLRLHVPEPPRSSPIALWNFELEGLQFLWIVTGDKIVTGDRMR